MIVTQKTDEKKNRVHDPRKVVELSYLEFMKVYSDVFLVDKNYSRRGMIYKTDLFTVLLFFKYYEVIN